MKHCLAPCSIILGLLSLTSVPAAELGQVTLSSSPTSERVISVDLPPDLDHQVGYALRNGDTVIPFQVEHGNKRGWFMPPAGAATEWILTTSNDFSEVVVVADQSDKDTTIRHNGNEVLTYHHGLVSPPAGAKPHKKEFKIESFIRNGFIHPLRSPAGAEVTEAFTHDHTHHTGLWLAWVNTDFAGRKVDFWNLGKETGKVEFTAYDIIESGPVFARIRAHHDHTDISSGEEHIALKETWDVRVTAEGGADQGFWSVDIESTMHCATDRPLILNQYRYGGMGFRGHGSWRGDNYRVLTANGHSKADGHATRARWCAHNGQVDGADRTVVTMSHPDNYLHPEPMRIWKKGGAFFCWSPVQAGERTLEPEQSYRFRYRFYVHEGPIDAERAEAAWQDYAHPISARFAR